MTTLWRDYVKLALLCGTYVFLYLSYVRNPAARPLHGLSVPKFMGGWLREGVLCRDVNKACDETCGDATTLGRRCSLAARQAIGRASGRCYSALYSIDAAAEAVAAARLMEARTCLRRSYRDPFRRQGLPAPKLVLPSDWKEKVLAKYAEPE